MRKLFRYVWAVAAAGAVGIVVGPIIAPTLATTLRPAAKSGIKGGLLLVSKGRRRVSELRESMEDLIAESRHELGDTKE